MFKNKNWLKVLVPEIVMTLIAMAVFFGCRWLGMESKEAAFAVAAVTLTAAFVPTFAVAAAVAAVVVVALAFPTFAVAAVAAVVAVALAFAAADEYKLPKFWVFVSYLVEAAVIFFSIYFFLN